MVHNLNTDTRNINSLVPIHSATLKLDLHMDRFFILERRILISFLVLTYIRYFYLEPY